MVRVELIRGDAADAMMGDAGTLARWGKLWRECPWATAYQSPAYLSTWYRVYRPSYEPILLVGSNQAGETVGLLPLAMQIRGGAIEAAGGYQSEYQTWICRPEVNEAFATLAIEEFIRNFPASRFSLKYLPADVSLRWLADARMEDLCLLRQCRQPLMLLGDGSDADQSLHKSGNKSRLRQLKKFGVVEFTRVEDPGSFGSLLDEFASCHDSRYLAIHGCAPFQCDRFRKEFLRDLMRTPGAMHVTTLRVGGQLASAHFDLIKGRELQLGTIAHNPLFSRFSPGKLHILFLARMLAEQGFEKIDLTPGGEAYKERFANAHDVVHTLNVYATPARRLLGEFRHTMKDAMKRSLREICVTPPALRSIAQDITTFGLVRTARTFLRRGINWIASTTETSVYEMETAATIRLDLPQLRRDKIEDLMAFAEMNVLVSAQRFMADAMRRMDDHHHFYTLVEEGHVQAIAWVLERPSKEIAQIAAPGIGGGEQCAVIMDLHVAQGQERANKLEQLVRSAVQQLSCAGMNIIFATIPSHSPERHRIVQAVGFGYIGAITRQTRFGKLNSQAIPIVRPVAEDLETIIPLNAVEPPQPAPRKRA